jgi:hypothetical protein
MFEMHRAFCATPWELEAERILFYDRVGQFNETAGMPKGILFVPVSLAYIMDKRPLQHAVDDNIRECRHYILVLEEDWGPKERNFRRDYALALECLADPALPMRDVAVLLKKPPAGISPAEDFPEPRAAFSTREEFAECIDNLFSAWLQAIPSTGTAPAL